MSLNSDLQFFRFSDFSEYSFLPIIGITNTGPTQTPLLVPGGGPFSNSNIFVLDQFMTETKADFKISICPLLNLGLH